MKRFIASFGLGVLLVAAAAPLTAQATDTFTETIRETIPISGSSSCTGDADIEGTAVLGLTNHTTVTGTRLILVSRLSFTQIKATGESGTTYTGAHVENLVQTGRLDGTGTTTLTFVIRDLVVSTGSGGNEKMTLTVHLTVLPSGEVVGSPGNATFGCVG